MSEHRLTDFSGLLRRLRAYAVRLIGKEPPPVNYLRRDPALIDEDVKYAIANSRSNLEYVLERCGTSISKSVVLEIGPGTNFAPQLVIAGKGAKVLVADRFLAPWNPSYHPEFYRRFLDAWREPCPALLKVIEKQCYPADIITLIEEPIEELNSIPDQSVDVVISNAVMEHVVDLDAAIRELARIARPNGVQSHQVDFRDHKDFDRPLDFLTIGDRKYKESSRPPAAKGEIAGVPARWLHCWKAMVLSSTKWQLANLSIRNTWRPSSQNCALLNPVTKRRAKMI